MDTVNWLYSTVQNVTIDPDTYCGKDTGQTDAHYIFARMTDVARSPTVYWNTMEFHWLKKRPTNPVWKEKDTGFANYTMPSGK